MIEDFGTASKDMPTRMVWAVGDNELYATRHDPYGYWYFSYKRGQLPRELEGAFTGEAKVLNAADSYIKRKEK